jgi:putative ABC transport system ATP-binding protein
MNSIISVKNLQKSFHPGGQTVAVLKDISFEVEKGDFIIIIGPSGCGKSTLLHTLLGLENPDSGTVTILGQSLYDGTAEDDRCEFRKRHIGMVYQQPNWIKSLSIMENVCFPLLLFGQDRFLAIGQAVARLKEVGMDGWRESLPTELSGGQQQKVSVARALVTNPEILVADEPTGNLDYHSGQELMQLLTKLNQAGKTIIMVTHDLEYLKFAKRSIKMLDGKIVETFTGEAKEKMLREIKGKRGVGV